MDQAVALALLVYIAITNVLKQDKSGTKHIKLVCVIISDMGLGLSLLCNIIFRTIGVVS